MADRPIQLHLELPYKIEPRQHREIARYLDAGWRIQNLQRISDREALVTMDPPAAAGESAG